MQTDQADDPRERIRKFRKNRRGMALLLALFAAYALSAVFRTTYDRLTWVPAPGVVTAVGVEPKESRQTGTTGPFYPDVSYQYVAAGQTHHGESFQFAGRPSSHRQATLTANEYARGDSVTVYVNPRDPGASVLRNTVEPLLMFAPLLAIMGLIVMYWIPNVWYAKRAGTISSYADWW